MAERKSLDELAKIIDKASQEVEIGARYMHYKQLYYIVENVAILEATNGPAVIYRAEYDKRLLFIRPLSVWLEAVEWQGEAVPRFRRAD